MVKKKKPEHTPRNGRPNYANTTRSKRKRSKVFHLGRNIHSIMHQGFRKRKRKKEEKDAKTENQRCVAASHGHFCTELFELCFLVFLLGLFWRFFDWKEAIIVRKGTLQYCWCNDRRGLTLSIRSSG